MKKLLSTIIIISLLPITILSQSCLPEGIVFETQEQIDNFQIDNPGCTVIEGDVEIGYCHGGSTDITNLDGLSVLTSVEGNLGIGHCYSFPSGNPYLSSILGLSNLTYIGGNLNICQNPILTSLSGLEKLTHIGGYLNISYHDSLTDITAFENLTYLGSGLIIDNNEDLESLTGLEGLESVNFLQVWFNKALPNLNGLDNVSSIDESLAIEGNIGLVSLAGLEKLSTIGGDVIIGCEYGWLHHSPSLISLTGLDNLVSIGGQLWINLNDSLASLTGLEKLVSIGGSLRIHDNPMLSSLAGIDNIIADSILSLFIHDNMSLSTCEVQSVCDYLVSPNGESLIYGNAEGCNNAQQVLDSCDFSSITNYDFIHLTIHPNPFSTSTNIKYELQQPTAVQITIYNHLGKQIEVIQQQQLTGKQQVVWNAEGLTDGIYYFRLQAGEQTANGKMVKVR